MAKLAAPPRPAPVLSGKSKAELDNLLANYDRRGQTSSPVYLDALAMRETMYAGMLTFDATVAAIRAAALDRRCISYEDVAEASGSTIQKARMQLPAHLARVMRYALCKGWPLITATVVTKAGVATGTMEGSALESFLKACAAHGQEVPAGEPEGFVREQQEKTFAWAQEEG